MLRNTLIRSPFASLSLSAAVLPHDTAEEEGARSHRGLR